MINKKELINNMKKKAALSMLTACVIGTAVLAPAGEALAWGYTCPDFGWKQDEKGWKYLRPTGKYITDSWGYLKGKEYYFDDGYMVTGWKKTRDRWNYFAEDGIVVFGWVETDGKWYYINEGGGGQSFMVTGWNRVEGKWYYMDAHGARQTGWKWLNGKWYYFDEEGVMANQWKEIDGKWYYFIEGVMQTGWIRVGEQKISEKKTQAKTYFLASNGAMQTGWKKIDGSWYFFLPNGTMAVGWKKVQGKSYYFFSNGKMAQDEWIQGYHIKEDGLWDGKAKVKGWTGNRYYTGTDAYLRDQWIWIDDYCYCFGEDGNAVTADSRTGIKVVQGKAVDSSGRMCKKKEAWDETVIVEDAWDEEDIALQPVLDNLTESWEAYEARVGYLGEVEQYLRDCGDYPCWAGMAYSVPAGTEWIHYDAETKIIHHDAGYYAVKHSDR